MNKILFIIIIGLLFHGCENPPLPKPTGYFRIDLPEKNYALVDSIPFPFRFNLPEYAAANLERTKTDANFLNIDFNNYSARIHMSYIPVQNNLANLLEDSRSLVYKHTSKAQNIKEQLIVNKKAKVFGLYYQIDGNAASGSQFYLTDSVNHFVRGALYFNTSPNYDSIAPVQEFIKADIEEMIESFEWKK